MENKLIQFWKRHPKAKLSLYSLGDALDNSSNELRNAVIALKERGILVAQLNDNGLITYTLSTERPLESPVELSKCC
jgi:hypothetical protein